MVVGSWGDEERERRGKRGSRPSQGKLGAASESCIMARASSKGGVGLVLVSTERAVVRCCKGLPWTGLDTCDDGGGRWLGQVPYLVWRGGQSKQPPQRRTGLAGLVSSGARLLHFEWARLSLPCIFLCRGEIYSWEQDRWAAACSNSQLGPSFYAEQKLSQFPSCSIDVSLGIQGFGLCFFSSTFLAPVFSCSSRLWSFACIRFSGYRSGYPNSASLPHSAPKVGSTQYSIMAIITSVDKYLIFGPLPLQPFPPPSSPLAGSIALLERSLC